MFSRRVRERAACGAHISHGSGGARARAHLLRPHAALSARDAMLKSMLRGATLWVRAGDGASDARPNDSWPLLWPGSARLKVWHRWAARTQRRPECGVAAPPTHPPLRRRRHLLRAHCSLIAPFTNVEGTATDTCVHYFVLPTSARMPHPRSCTWCAQRGYCARAIHFHVCTVSNVLNALASGCAREWEGSSSADCERAFNLHIIGEGEQRSSRYRLTCRGS